MKIHIKSWPKGIQFKNCNFGFTKKSIFVRIGTYLGQINLFPNPPLFSERNSTKGFCFRNNFLRVRLINESNTTKEKVKCSD